MTYDEEYNLIKEKFEEALKWYQSFPQEHEPLNEEQIEFAKSWFFTGAYAGETIQIQKGN